MDRDDLRAALGDLAVQVGAHRGDALMRVQERGRRRRQRRSRIISAATSAAVIAIVLSGIAVAGHHQSSEVIATGPKATSSSTSTPTTSGVCTDADAHASGGVPMPAPTRITATRVYNHGTERLDPPPAGLQARVSAAQAWAGLHGTASPVARYEVALTAYSAVIPSTGGVPNATHVLAWVVIGTHVPLVPVGRTVAELPCAFETQLTIFDALSGQQLGESDF